MARAPLLSPLGKWLNYVDGQLEEVEGLAYLKLALHSEIDQKTRVSIKAPSFLFHELKGRHGEEALPMYHCALLSMGRKLRGRMCVDNAKQLFGLDLPPPISTQKQSKEFKFFQCLTRISKVLRGQEGEEKLLKYFSRKEYLRRSHHNIHGLPDLFVRLFNDRKITPDDTQNLYTSLQHYDLDKALRHLHEYRGSVSGDMSVKDEEKDDDSSDPSSALTTSTAMKRPRKLSQSASVAPQGLNGQSSNEEGGQIISAAPKSLHSHPTNQDAAMTTSNEVGIHGPITKSTESQTDSWGPLEQMKREESTGNRSHCKGICLCCLLLLLALLFLLLLGVLSLFSLYLWHPLHSAETNSHPPPTLQRQGETVVLTEVKETIVQEVTVQELVYGSDSPHIIDILLVQSACNGLAKNSTHYNFSGNRNQFKSNVSYYMLPGSEIKYNICAFSNYSKADIIQVYIIEGLQQDREFNPDNDYYHDKKVKHWPVEVGKKGKTKCTPITFEVHHWNYYTIRTFIHNEKFVTWAHYDLTIDEVYIDLDQTANTTLDSDNKQATYHFHFGFNTWCLVAYIQTETVPGFDQHVHTLVKYKLRYEVVIGVTVTISVLLVVGTMIVLSVICCIKWKLQPTIVEKCLAKYKPHTRRRRRIQGKEYSSLTT